MSKLLAMLMQKQKTAVLNCTIIGNPTITSDFIITYSNSNNKVEFKPQPTNFKSWRIITKFRINNLNTSAGYIITPSIDRQGLRFAYNKDNVGVNGFNVLVGYNNVWQNQDNGAISNVYYNVGEWWYFSIEYNATTTKLSIQKSLDNVSYTELKNISLENRNYFSNSNLYQYLSSGGTANNNDFNIDLKETKYYIDGQLSFEAVSYI